MELEKNIFTTYYRKDYPEELNHIKEEYEKINPNWKLHYYNDEDCEIFIKQFYPEFWECYDKLIPTAYKADLFRCLIVYHFGGVYCDIKVRILKPLEQIIDDKEFYAFKDYNAQGIWNGFFYSVKNNPLLMLIAQSIKLHVDNNVYFTRTKLYIASLALTGPILWSICWKKYNNYYSTNDPIDYTEELGHISNNQLGKPILMYKKGSRDIIAHQCDEIVLYIDYGKYEKTKKQDYGILYNERKLYKNIELKPEDDITPYPIPSTESILKFIEMEKNVVEINNNDNIETKEV